MLMKLATIPEWATISAYLCAAIAGFMASLFALHKFKINREGEAILELALSVDTIPAANLVEVSIHVKNVGKTGVYVAKENLKRALLMVRKISSSENHAQLVWETLEKEELIDSMEYIPFYGADAQSGELVLKESPSTSGWRETWLAFTRPIGNFLILLEYGIPIRIFKLLYSLLWPGEPYDNEYPMIYEPATITTHSVFFSTDYHGAIWIRAELTSAREYRWRPLTTYRWRVDRLFILHRQQ